MASPLPEGEVETCPIPLLHTLLRPRLTHSNGHILIMSPILQPNTVLLPSAPLPGVAAPAVACAGCSLCLTPFPRCPLSFLTSSEPPALGPTLHSLLKPAATSSIPVIFFPSNILLIFTEW